MTDKASDKPMQMKIKKKDGKMEEFSREKLMNSLKKAGMESEDNMAKTADSVTGFVKEAGKQGAVESSKIREKVVGQMKSLNSAAADKFSSFKKGGN
jgi:transcriptional regulator NrdR family protein